ncbi:MAG: glycosyltransferase family 2 protein [Candidatus Woykebacteria bacterium]
MLNDKKISVVVPAYNEEKLIIKVLSSIPDFVDSIIVVNDQSKDKTKSLVSEYQRKEGRVTLINHEKNMGVGAAIASGYEASISEGNDVTAVMAGDFQMSPEELIRVIRPVAEGKADYVKGNRLFTGEAWSKIPKVRYIGNAFLSLLTKIASGYWHVADSQCGYTAVSNKIMKLIDLDGVYPRYGFPNDFLVRLNVASGRVVDVPVTPIYGVGEKSGIKIWKVFPLLSYLLLKLFFWRIFQKYVIRDFHPLVFFYLLGSILFFAGVLLGLYESYLKIFKQIPLPTATVVLVALFIILGLQSIFFAMWFDMEYNRDLK